MVERAIKNIKVNTLFFVANTEASHFTWLASGRRVISRPNSNHGYHPAESDLHARNWQTRRARHENDPDP